MTVRDNPLFASQWHFQLIGDIETVWTEFTGQGVNVGIYDDGTQRTHPDLAPNYDASLHYSNLLNDDGQPASSTDSHGTAVAGLIGAADNTVGGVGVAFDASLTGVSFLTAIQNAGFNVTLDAMRHAQNFDVMNNSWGYTPSFDQTLSLSQAGSFGAQLADAFRVATSEGRGGLGTIIVNAAGNEANNAGLIAQGVFGNAHGSGINNLHELIIVAATGRNGFVEDYSNFGVNLTVSAPAASVTTDLTGVAGDSSGNFTTSFGGTSAATPVVAGVVSLMLQANSGLGWRDVQSILSVSAAHTGSNFGSARVGDEVGEWVSNSASNWNGGGMTYHMSYGFGMVDAFAAVRMAEIWTRLHGTAQTTANMISFTTSSAPGSVAVSDNSTAVIPVTVNRNISIEHIYVTIAGSHSYSGDLVIRLISPTGEVYVLMRNELRENDFTGSWSFGITATLGETSQGEWQVEVEDTASGDRGQITNVSLRFEGSPITTNTVHHITEDFRLYAAVETDRRQITDTDGGTDWLNMVAVPGATVIDLSANAVIRVAGETWGTLVNGDQFENVATGDGNDTITGNLLDNDILAGRGNDVVDAGFGADTIEGGRGHDNLTGAQGADHLFGGDGNDTIFGNTATDIIFGGVGNDSVSGGEGADQIDGGAGNDTLFGRTGADVISGGDGNDSIIGSEGADLLNGGAGNDTMFGSSAFDTLFGNDGDDFLFGNFGSDLLSGGNGNDELTGGSGDDTLRGGDGADTIFGNQGRDSIEGGAGNDVLRGGTLADRFVFTPGFGNDRIEDFEDNQDSLRIASSVTGNVVLTGQQVIDQYAEIVGGVVVFDFGGGMTITLEGVTTTANLADNIFIV